MPDVDKIAEQLVHHCRDLRSLLQEHGAPGLEAVDQLTALVERTRARKARLDFGFVGESQVGKSTLINALVGDATLPSGGIGPLTAQATEVSYADESSIWVRYHTRAKVNQLAFAIERYLSARTGEAVSDNQAERTDDEDELDKLLPIDGTEPGARSERGEYFLKQAKLMLSGGTAETSEISEAALLRGLRAVLSGPSAISGDTELAPHADRIALLASKCNTTERLSVASLGGPREFASELKLRAAGSLAPLVAELKVSLNKDFLRHATLVDLPGIGVVGDPAASVAEEFVRLRGDALIIVTRNNGLPETIAQLLERTGVITKMLFGAPDDDPMHVIVAVTYVDNVARDRYAEEFRRTRDEGTPPPDRAALFRTLADGMREQIRGQVRDALRASPSFDDLPADKKARRDDVVTRLCASLDVMVVAANDFLNISDGQADLAFLKDSDATGIPAFRARVAEISAQLAQRRCEAILGAARELYELMEGSLSAIAQMYEEGGGRANADWERFRDGLGGAVADLREEMKAHHGEIIATLKTALPTKIEVLCKNASAVALQRLRRLRKRGEDELYVKSLQAALVRGGVWNKKSINYPDSLTRSFVDSVASDWEPVIIESVRGTMKALAERDVSLVERLCEHAERFDERIVGDAHIDAQKKLMRQQARACISWTRERLEQFREDVQQKLFAEVSPPIEKAASQAVKAGAHRGTGAKQRILDAFEEGGAKAVAKAESRAIQVLKQYYDQLFLELHKEYLQAHHDPLSAAFDALTNEELHRARRSDAQHRRRVLAAVDSGRQALADAMRLAS